MPAKALVAMSGGVDSSVAAALMLEKGYHCTSLTFKLYDNGVAVPSTATTTLNDAQEAARQLGMAHHVLDLSKVFRNEVIQRFIETYEKGATPNPCIDCNRKIKFAFPLFEAEGLCFDLYATGHYAQVEKSGGRWLLKKASDPSKDQSYVLFSLSQEVLSRCCFPLGGMTKNQVREIAEARGLASAEKLDSQDICFVPGRDHGAFIEQFTGKSYQPGDILDMDGNVIGRHRGIVRYTLGQRRGLAVALNQPLYVKAMDAIRNTITMGPDSALYSKTLIADRINLIACENIEKPMKVKVRTRYMQQEHSAWALQTAADEIRLDFDDAQRAITPGQAVVLYDGDIVIGGGIICFASSSSFS